MRMKKNRDAGFSLLEIIIVTAIFGALMSMMYGVISSTLKADVAHRARIGLQLEATRGMQALTNILKLTGRIDQDEDGSFSAGDYPYIYDEVFDDLASNYDGFYGFVREDNPNAQQSYSLGGSYPTEWIGSSDEIVFLLPSDEDMNGGPTNVDTGEIEWGTDSHSIVIVPDGENSELQYRRYNEFQQLVDRRTLARFVERIELITYQTEGPVIAPQRPLGLDQVRVVAYFRRVDLDGLVHTTRQSTTVNYRSYGK